MGLVVPAVLPSSKKDLEEKLLSLSTTPVERIQIDVVDGLFATPASWPYNATGEPSTKSDFMLGKMLPHLERISYEIDLMCLDAERAGEAWLARGAARLTFHVESDTNPKRLLVAARRRLGHVVEFGLALNINTDNALLEKFLGDIDYVQFMGINNIGSQGQAFEPRVLEKIRVFHQKHPEIAIQVDGGVSLDNAKKLLNAGATSLVVGSKILKAKDPAAEVALFEALQTSFGV